MHKQLNVMITGASGGIGLALSRIFAQNGHDLILTFRTQQKSLKEFPKARLIQLDLTDPYSIQACAENSSQIPIDVLINNAGSLSRGTMLESSIEDIDYMIDANLRGPMHLTKLLLPRIHEDGCIINVSSDAAVYGRPGLAAYIAAKSGLIGWTRALAQDHRRLRIYVAEVGLTATAMSDHHPAGMDPAYVADELYHLAVGHHIPDSMEFRIGPVFFQEELPKVVTRSPAIA